MAKPNTPGPGHNSIAADQLKQIVERVERMEAEKKGAADDIKEILAEAKSNGFDTKTIRKIVKLRARDKDKVEEENAMLALYANAMGMADYLA